MSERPTESGQNRFSRRRRSSGGEPNRGSSARGSSGRGSSGRGSSGRRPSRPTAFEWPEFERPEPGSLRRLEDDSPWFSGKAPSPASESDGLRTEDLPEYWEQQDDSERRRPSRPEGVPRHGRRSRLAALLVLVVIVVTMAIVGLEAGGSEKAQGAGRPVPFSLLPFDGSGVTVSTKPATTSSVVSTTTTMQTPNAPTSSAATSTVVVPATASLTTPSQAATKAGRSSFSTTIREAVAYGSATVLPGDSASAPATPAAAVR